MQLIHPFPNKIPGDKLTNQEIINALRLSLCAEEEATSLYDTIAEYVGDERIKKVMKSVADEEQIHIGEFQALLDIFESDEKTKTKEGRAETDDILKEDMDIKNTANEVMKLVKSHNIKVPTAYFKLKKIYPKETFPPLKMVAKELSKRKRIKPKPKPEPKPELKPEYTQQKLFEVSEDVEIILNNNKYLLERGDKLKLIDT